MAQMISLDDSSYDEIYEKAMEMLRIQAPWWTHTEVSDPGIMLLEMWALLMDMQSFYLDQVQESHYRKYLKLLGIRPDEGECARTWVFFDHVEEDCTVPVGTKLLADRMVFETKEEVRLINNRLTGFFMGDGTDRSGAMMLQRKSSFVLREEWKKQLFSFTLEKPLEPGQDSLFFILLREEKERRPATEEFYMAKLVWEYRTKEGWREARVVRDDTQGLLYSGLTGIRTDIPMDTESGLEIRCRIKKGAYDVMPTLYKIYLNAAEVVQRNTLCCEEDVDFSEKCHRVALKSYLARTGRLWILRRKDKDKGAIRQEEALWEDITDSPEVMVDPPVTARYRERYIFFAGEGRIRVVSSAAGITPEELVGEVTGVAAQQIPLPWERILRSSVSLMLRHGGEKQYLACRMEEPEEDRYANAWHWKEEENVIVLGDGRHGDIPYPSQDGLRFTSLALWEGEKGNISINRITAWERPELFPGITCTNRLTGRGGRERRLPSQQFQEAGERFPEQNRMITEADIQYLAKGTPGLLIREVKARWRNGVLIVKLIPKHELRSRYCGERYRSQAEKYLEQYRLAGTKLVIEIGDE
ncbi:MAG: hypothetical protein K2O34_01970 [Acetatifactor sp.]|nr:hypothetical protein [Acetatifactor sp.]